MVKMDKATLNKAVKEFIKKKDPETAKQFIIMFGSKIEDYDINKALKELEPKKKEDK